MRHDLQPISASHLLTASVMSAPASLAISKLFWPETETPKVTLKSGIKMEKGDSKNLLEAASQGATASIPLVANIAVNLIAFLALLAFVDSALSWLGNMFDYPQLSFEVICAYVFMPFSFMMGVDWEDSFIVGGLLGYKTFFNEFVAYEHLSELIHKREKGGPVYMGGVKQYMTIRSETIATYALCGFANFGSLGLVIGGLSKDNTDNTELTSDSLFIDPLRKQRILSVPVVEDVPCYIMLGNAFNSTGSPSNTTKVIRCCQDLFNRYGQVLHSLFRLAL
uniref:Solute carrier family 28 member 3 n=1 Tax=Crocodylus porosus TaxID=8502 RepID=A0A7M4FV80_CROPO